MAGYLPFDDYQNILENPGLQSISLGGLARFWTQPYFGLYIPVTCSLWWLVSVGLQLSGAALLGSAWLFHSVNLVLHLGNAVLVFLLVSTLLERSRSSLPASDGQVPKLAEKGATQPLAAAFLFALHPVLERALAIRPGDRRLEEQLARARGAAGPTMEPTRSAGP